MATTIDDILMNSDARRMLKHVEFFVLLASLTIQVFVFALTLPAPTPLLPSGSSQTQYQLT